MMDATGDESIPVDGAVVVDEIATATTNTTIITPDDTELEQPDEVVDVSTSEQNPQLDELPSKLSPLSNTKSKLKAVMNRAVHDTKMVPNVMKQHTKQAAQRTTQSVTTAMHHVSGQFRTIQTKVQHHRKTGHNNNNNNTTKDASRTTTATMNDTTEATTNHNVEDVLAANDDIDDDRVSNVLGENSKVTVSTNSPTAPTTTTNPPTLFTVSPLMEFITADLTLIFIFTLSAACYPIYEHYDLLFHPMSTTVTPLFVLTRIGLPWMIAAFTLGLAIGQFISSGDEDDGNDFWRWLFHSFTATTTAESTTTLENIQSTQSDELYENLVSPSVDTTTNDVVSDTMNDSITKKKHTLFMTLLGSNRSARIRFRNSPMNSRTASQMMTNAKNLPPVKVWTTLTNPRVKKDANSTMDDASTLSMTSTTTSGTTTTIPRSIRLAWQRQITPTEDGYLMQHLLKHESFRRIITVKKPAATISVPNSIDTSNDDDMTSDSVNDGIMKDVQQQQQQPQQQQLGSFDLKEAVADTLEGYVITPLFQLRGMDIFLSDDIPEMESSTHPYLIENGLRSVPTFIVNVLTQWGNILIYFEMPSWVRSFNMIVDESDPDDVKAFKRFLNGDTDYRNDRLKMIPSLVDGPMPIRMVAPPKREKVVNCDWMPITWNQHDEEISPDGSILYPIMEATLDCMTSRPIRSMAGLVKKYLHILSVDAAIVIGTPERQQEPEPSACLGLWRFNHIDISVCPHLPDRYQVETKSSTSDENLAIAADIQRASIAIQAM